MGSRHWAGTEMTHTREKVGGGMNLRSFNSQRFEMPVETIRKDDGLKDLRLFVLWVNHVHC